MAGRPRRSLQELSIQDEAWWNGWSLAIIQFTDNHQRELNQNKEMTTTSTLDEAALTEAHLAEVSRLQELIMNLEVRVRESQSQRAILESVISERLDSERAAVSAAGSLKKSLRRASTKCNELEAERERDRQSSAALARESAKREQLLQRLETELAEVESFMGSADGSGVLKLEAELASCRLALAEVEEEKDELEAELANYRALDASSGGSGDESDEEVDTVEQQPPLRPVLGSHRRDLHATGGSELPEKGSVLQARMGKENAASGI